MAPNTYVALPLDGRRVDTVLFDLDGTLLDSAPDLTRALNQVLRAHSIAEVDPALARSCVSQGALGLLRLALGEDEVTAERLRPELIEAYQNNGHTLSKPFDGVEMLLAQLEACGLRWGIITNKDSSLTLPLLKQIGWFERVACVVCGDTAPEKKPSPLPLWLACARAGIEAETAIYVGDDIRDIYAANAAGMPSVAAVYGYLGNAEPVAQWPASVWVNTPAELLECLN